MQRLEVNGAVRPLQWPLGVKGLIRLLSVFMFNPGLFEANKYLSVRIFQVEISVYLVPLCSHNIYILK